MRQLIRFVALAWLLGLLPGTIRAQIFTGPQNPIRQAEEEALRQRVKERQDRERKLQYLTFPYSALPKDAPSPYHLGDRASMQRLFPYYEGLPTYPNNVPGYGGYPGAGKTPNEFASGRVTGLEKPPADKDRWPSWIEGGMGDTSMRSTPQQAVLVRVADRVWFKAPEELEFIPLAFYDRFRFMTVGTHVAVRGKGEFHMVLHTGGNVSSRGPCALEITAMDTKEVGLQLRAVGQMWIKAGLRPYHVTLPDGTEVTFSDTLLYLQRRGDRCRVANLGGSPIRFAGSAGSGELTGPTRLHVWMRPPSKPPLSRELEARGDVATTRIGKVTTVRGGTGGRVTWSGAGFKVPGGTTLEIKPLADPRAVR